jgi:cytochrome P450
VTAPLLYDQLAELGIEDAYPRYVRLRDEAPTYHNPDRGFWALSRLKDIEAAARDWEAPSREPCVDPEPARVHLRLDSIVDLDPPLHDLLRRIVKDHVTPRAIEEMEVTTAAVADDLVRDLVCAGEAELSRDIACVLPSRVAMAVLCLPAEDLPFLRDTVEKVWQGNRFWIEPAQNEPSRLAGAQIREFFAAALPEHERHPTGDVLSAVVHGRLDGAEQQTRSLSGYIEPMSLINEVRRTGRAEAEERGEA